MDNVQKFSSLIIQRAFGEDENITNALLRRDLGYLEFTDQEIQSNDYCDFNKSIKAVKNNEKQIKVNSAAF